MQKSKNEQVYTSTDQKLLQGGLERLTEFQQTGMLRPQSLQLAPEDKCQMDCTWCLSSDTTIAMWDAKNKTINKVQKGEKVVSINLKSGKREPATIQKTFKRKTTEHYKILTRSGNLIKSSEEHPFYTKKQGWVKCANLKKGDVIYDVLPRTLQSEKIKRQYAQGRLKTKHTRSFLENLKQRMIQNNPMKNGDEIISIQKTNRKITVYNFECVPNNNFLVKGHQKTGNWLLSHNCSTKWRNYEMIPDENDPSKVRIGEKKESADSLAFGDVCKTVHELMEVGPLKTVELTGGGDATLYPYINELIHYLHDIVGVQVGLITNGMGLTNLVSQDSLDKLTWLRCSLASFDPQNFHNNNDGKKNHRYADRFPDLPERMNGTIGFSYVWGPYSRVDVLDKIAEYAQEYQVDFVRIVPDCLNAKKQQEFREEVSEVVSEYNERIGREVLFFQSKRYDVHSFCAIGFLKPFLNADGYFYHCSAVPLYNQKFTPHWRMGHMSEVKEIWTPENVGAFDTSHCEYGKCFYAQQNELLDSVRGDRAGPHKDFV